MTDLYVSEHAVERYRERIGSTLSTPELREKIENLVRTAAAVGASRCAVAGVTFSMLRSGDDCTVTTVYGGSLPHPSHRKVPRSDESRKESKRQQRRFGKRAGR